VQFTPRGSVDGARTGRERSFASEFVTVPAALEFDGAECGREEEPESLHPATEIPVASSATTLAAKPD
jgi:hypothetical protein